jgi:hypothetical protein
MPTLQLHAVTPRQGLFWVGSAFRLYFGRPFAFTGLFVMFLLAMYLVTGILPLVGGAVSLVTMPLLSLGFMVAVRSALDGGAVHPGQFIEPLRGDGKRRRALLALCALHGAIGALVLLLWHIGFGEPVQRFMQQMSNSAVSQEEFLRAFLDEGVQGSYAALVVLWGVFVSAPFWYAAALVHWGGQSAAQAIFTSTLAVWRTKGAFALFLLGWVGVSLLFSFMSAIVLGLLGLAEAAVVAMFPAVVMFSTAFYVSLYFGFTDTFGAPERSDVSTL